MLDVFLLHGRWLLEFRGGPWRDYWMEDFLDEWALAETYTSLELSPSVYVFHENQGNLSIRNVPLPVENFEASVRANEIVNDATSQPPGRISKSGAAVHRICRHCPVRPRCNATDEQQGETEDWSKSYREELVP